MTPVEVHLDATIFPSLPKICQWFRYTSGITSDVTIALDDDWERVSEHALVAAERMWVPLVAVVHRLGARKSATARAAWAREIAAEIGVPP